MKKCLCLIVAAVFVCTAMPASADEIKNKLLMILQGGHLGAEQRKRAAQSVKKDFALRAYNKK